MPRFPVTLTTMAQILDKGIISHAARFAHTLEVGVLPAHRRQKGASTCSLDNSLEQAGHRTFGRLLKQPSQTSDQGVVLRGNLHSSHIIERLTDLLTAVVSFTFFERYSPRHDSDE
jgi:hypothetical protein